MAYALVENGEVKRVGLPQTGELKDGSTVSGFNLLDAETLKNEGWLPLIDEPPVYNAETEKVVSDGYTIGVNQVVTNYQVTTIGIDVARQRKIDGLKAIESAKLETFKSSALGTEHTYLSGLTDMLLLTGQYSYVKGSDFDGLDFMWYTEENGNVSHTAAQFVQMYLDARNNVSTVKYHRAALEYQVNVSTTVEDVNAIVW